MHECPHCWQVCDCIGDDVWDNSESAYCRCDCEDEFDDWEDDWEDD
jgi:hypothetical protein